MNWLDKILPSRIDTSETDRKKSVPEGLWTKCEDCQSVLYRAELERTLQVCPKCSAHRPINARTRIRHFLDEDAEQVEIGADVRPTDPLRFRDSKKYRDRLAEAQKSSGETDALVVMRGKLQGMPVVTASFEFSFLGGSMGSALRRPCAHTSAPASRGSCARDHLHKARTSREREKDRGRDWRGACAHLFLGGALSRNRHRVTVHQIGVVGAEQHHHEPHRAFLPAPMRLHKLLAQIQLPTRQY